MMLEVEDCDPVADTLEDCVTLDDPDKEGVDEPDGVAVALAVPLALEDEDWLDVPE